MPLFVFYLDNFFERYSSPSKRQPRTPSHHYDSTLDRRLLLAEPRFLEQFLNAQVVHIVKGLILAPHSPNETVIAGARAAVVL